MRYNEPVILEREFISEGTLILKQGDPGNSAYLIQSGAVEVFTEDDEGNQVHLAHLGLGQIIGEMALIFDDPRTASVRAVEDCNLIVLTRLAFEEKLYKTDPTIRAIMQMLTQRIISANNSMVNRKDSMDDLVDTAQIIYRNVYGSLAPTRRDDFQSEVLPKLDALLNAIRGFGDSE